MATVTKSSLNITSGGTINRTVAGSNTEFTCSSTQYAIVTITNMYIDNQAGAAINSSLTIGGVTMMQCLTATTGDFANVVRTVVSSTGGVAASPVGTPIILYVGPSQALATSIGTLGGVTVAKITGNYVIFSNT